MTMYVNVALLYHYKVVYILLYVVLSVCSVEGAEESGRSAGVCGGNISGEFCFQQQ